MQDRLAGADLPDVVQLTAEANAIEAGAGKAQPRRGGHRILTDSDGVASGVRVLGLQCAGQHLHALEEKLLDPGGLLLDLALQMLLIKSVLEHQRALLQRAGDPGLQLSQRNRLQQEVGGTEVETVDCGGGLAHAAQHDDRAVGKPLPHRLEEAHAIQLGHPHVGDDQRDLAGLIQDLESLTAGAGLQAMEALRLQHSR